MSGALSFFDSIVVRRDRFGLVERRDRNHRRWRTRLGFGSRRRRVGSCGRSRSLGGSRCCRRGWRRGWACADWRGRSLRHLSRSNRSGGWRGGRNLAWCWCRSDCGRCCRAWARTRNRCALTLDRRRAGDRRGICNPRARCRLGSLWRLHRVLRDLLRRHTLRRRGLRGHTLRRTTMRRQHLRRYTASSRLRGRRTKPRVGHHVVLLRRRSHRDTRTVGLAVRTQHCDRSHAGDRAAIRIDRDPHMAAFGINRHYLVDVTSSRRRAQGCETRRAYNPRNSPGCEARHIVSRAVIAWSVVHSLCRCGLRTRDTKRGKPKQECDRFFQGTLLMNGNIFVRRPCRTLAAIGAVLGRDYDRQPKT
jgi:hypothetical protein